MEGKEQIHNVINEYAALLEQSSLLHPDNQRAIQEFFDSHVLRPLFPSSPRLGDRSPGQQSQRNRQRRLGEFSEAEFNSLKMDLNEFSLRSICWERELLDYCAVSPDVRLPHREYSLVEGFWNYCWHGGDAGPKVEDGQSLPGSQVSAFHWSPSRSSRSPSPQNGCSNGEMMPDWARGDALNVSKQNLHWGVPPYPFSIPCPDACVQAPPGLENSSKVWHEYGGCFACKESSCSATGRTDLQQCPNGESPDNWQWFTMITPTCYVTGCHLVGPPPGEHHCPLGVAETEESGENSKLTDLLCAVIQSIFLKSVKECLPLVRSRDPLLDPGCPGQLTLLDAWIEAFGSEPDWGEFIGLAQMYYDEYGRGEPRPEGMVICCILSHIQKTKKLAARQEEKKEEEEEEMDEEYFISSTSSGPFPWGVEDPASTDLLGGLIASDGKSMEFETNPFQVCMNPLTGELHMVESAINEGLKIVDKILQYNVNDCLALVYSDDPVMRFFSAKNPTLLDVLKQFYKSNLIENYRSILAVIFNEKIGNKGTLQEAVCEVIVHVLNLLNQLSKTNGHGGKPKAVRHCTERASTSPFSPPVHCSRKKRRERRRAAVSCQSSSCHSQSSSRLRSEPAADDDDDEDNTMETRSSPHSDGSPSASSSGCCLDELSESEWPTLVPSRGEEPSASPCSAWRHRRHLCWTTLAQDCRSILDRLYSRSFQDSLQLAFGSYPDVQAVFADNPSVRKIWAVNFDHLADSERRGGNFEKLFQRLYSALHHYVSSLDWDSSKTADRSQILHDAEVQLLRCLFEKSLFMAWREGRK